ncbi:Restriction endonuclease [Anaerovibrio lipolyticus DSM 3074]|uniref:Restriction endonuclease n=1 Tax=Anaerovibrio lipolyticus DSM 3074 TaxID=1120997 RepID=A0A1M6CY19_9FIRM|nr:restriction endonuclease [Anaerovibrio lipolyticus]SHI65860.1 Restriction endonuclease [Anaerovibrio lipolyticus DSM 3074]
MSTIVVVIVILFVMYKFVYSPSNKSNSNIEEGVSSHASSVGNKTNDKLTDKIKYKEPEYISKYIYDQNILEKNTIFNQDYDSMERKIRKMDWRKFELFVSSVFEKNGYHCEVTPPSNDGGIDIKATKNGKEYLIECKYYEKSSVGREIIQKLVGAGLQYHCKNLIVVTTGVYNQNAVEAAEEINKEAGFNIQLLGINDLINMTKPKVNSNNDIKNRFPKGLQKMGTIMFFTYYIDFDSLKVEERPENTVFKINLNFYNASALQTVYRYIFRITYVYYGGKYVEYSKFDQFSNKYLIGAEDSLEYLNRDTKGNEVENDVLSILEAYYCTK